MFINFHVACKKSHSRLTMCTGYQRNVQCYLVGQVRESEQQFIDAKADADAIRD